MTKWLLLVYRVPTEPASKRVTIWRELKRLGALYLQQCVCLLPDIGANRIELERVEAKIVELNGESTRFEVPSLRAGDEAKIITAFCELRNKEYEEIIEECETKFVKEIEFERFRQNYSFEESEEIGQDLEKIRRWFERVVARDWFHAERRSAVEHWIDKCQDLLETFEQDVYERAGSDQKAEGTSFSMPINLSSLKTSKPNAPMGSETSGRDLKA